MAKKTPKKIIPELTKAGYQSFFENFSEDWVLEREYPMSKEELEVAEAIRKTLGKDTQIFAVRRVENPKGVHMPDLIINGQKVEIKGISGIKSVENAIHSAKKQGATSVIYHFQSDKLKQPESVVVDKIKQRTPSRGIENLIIYKKKNPSDKLGLIEKVLYNLTLSQNIEKVNRLNDKTPLSTYNPDKIEMKISKPKVIKTLTTIKQEQNKPQINQNATRKPRLRTQTRSYWQKRSLERTDLAWRESERYLKEIREVYRRAMRSSTKQVQSIYEKYYKDNEFDLNALRQIAPRGDVLKYRRQIRDNGLNFLLPDNYEARVSRLELVNLQMQAEVYKAGAKLNALTHKSLKETYQEGYYRTIYDTAKGAGHTPAFSVLNHRTVEKVLDTKFYGKNYSERVWGNTKILADQLKEVFATSVAIGQSIDRTSQLIRERFNVGFSSAERLVRTETMYFENQAEIDAYREMEIEEYQFLATLDTRTSEVCQHQDHKIYKVKDAKVGVNMPPLHPRCRSTITPYFGKEWEPELRIARDSNTGRNEYITNMSYKEWKDRFVSQEETGENIVQPKAQPERTQYMATNVHKGYIGNRVHLLPKINELRESNNRIASKFSDIYSGIEDKEIFLGYPNKETAKLYGANTRSKIYLTRSYALHMDNSGHITGVGYGVNAHNDKRPLTVKEIINIPYIIKTASPEEVSYVGVVRGAPRYNIIRKTSSNQTIVIEVSQSKKRIDIVTAYNITDKQYQYRKRLKK